jgi:hypothetical protein
VGERGLRRLTRTGIRAKVTLSVVMILTRETTDSVLGTCSVTLTDPDQVILTGHCFDADEDALGNSVMFNYETDLRCDRLPGYSLRFYKVKQVLNHTATSRPAGGLGAPQACRSGGRRAAGSAQAELAGCWRASVWDTSS